MKKEEMFFRQVPMHLKDFVALGRKRYGDGEPAAKIKAWLGDYHPPVYSYEGTDDYYDFMIFLCQECGDEAEAKRLSHLHSMVNEDTAKVCAAERHIDGLAERCFQVEQDEGVLEELSAACYETSRFFEYIIIETFLSRQQGRCRKLHENGRYRINMEYFMEQIETPGLWLLPADDTSLRLCELFGNLLNRLGHRVILIPHMASEEYGMLPSDSVLLDASMQMRQDYPDMAIIPAIRLRDKSGNTMDGMPLLLRTLCQTASESDYANVLATEKMFDMLQQTELRQPLECLGKYEGEIFQTRMTFGRIGSYLSYLEQIFQEPIKHLLDAKPCCKYSIIIPARNSAKYLQYTIQTCLNQRYQGGYEVLISDNSSEGNTEVWELCRKLDDAHIRYIRVPKDVDISKSFEYACLHAEGEYFFSIGSDDGILPWTLQALDTVVARHPDEPIILWNSGNYMWPDYDDNRLFRANTLYVPGSYKKGDYRTKKVRADDMLLYALKDPCGMYALPSSYINSCYKKSFLKEILAWTGRLRNGCCPDIYMGTVASVLRKEILYLNYPMAIAAQSHISTGAASNFTFSNDLQICKNERSLMRGIYTLSPTERLLPDTFMDYGTIYQSMLRLVSLGCLPQELLEKLDWKQIYRNISGQFPKNKAVYEELMHNLRYSAMKLGEGFLEWFDEEIYCPGRRQAPREEEPKNMRMEDYAYENGDALLTLYRYGAKNICDAVKIFQIITEL